jgi:hypothetical protein
VGRVALGQLVDEHIEIVRELLVVGVDVVDAAVEA